MASQISVIFPTFNRSELLVEALAAIAAQTRPPAQVIVWDDGSTDGTSDAVSAVKAKTGLRVEYRRAENGGKSRALNCALELADGDYIWICDDDDISLPDAAERLGKVLDTGAADIAAGRHLRFSTADGVREVTDTGYWPDPIDGSLLRHTLEDIFFFQNATLVRRECYDRVGPFDTTLRRSIDYDMTVRLLARFPAQLVPGIVFHQRKHDGLRGQAGAQHAASESERVWRDADRVIFARLRDQLPLSLYEGMFEAGEDAVGRRAGLLQRATVYARRGDWCFALRDFESAAGILPNSALDDTEQRIVVRAMAGKHGLGDVLAPPRRRAIRHLATAGRAGADIARWLSRGILWRLRAAVEDRQGGYAIRLLRFLAANPPVPSIRQAPPAAALIERRELPREVYAW